MKKLSVKEVEPKEVSSCCGADYAVVEHYHRGKKMRDDYVCSKCEKWCEIANPSETNCTCKQGSNGDRYSQGCSLHSETNEAHCKHLKNSICFKCWEETHPVESVSQPKAVDGYLKEFDERFAMRPEFDGKFMKQATYVKDVTDFFEPVIERARQCTSYN